MTKSGELVIDGCVPKNLRRGTTLMLSLMMAHPVDDTYRFSCGHPHLQRLSFNEFLKWSERA